MTEQPDTQKRVYLMGIGGIAMGTLAAMLAAQGFEVSGSDAGLYPPMSTFLERLPVRLFIGYDPANLEAATPDTVVIGNVIRRDNPEAQWVLTKGLPRLSMPQALQRYFIAGHRSMVVAGTHGKSTTSGLLGWILEQAGLDPGVFVGGFINNWGRGYRIGSGPYVVLEGDEYDTAFFDKGPKFLHYLPHIGILTSVEFDHADIFADLDAVRDVFRRFVGILAPDGALIVNADDPECMALAADAPCRVMTYGIGADADYRIQNVDYRPGEVRFEVAERDHAPLPFCSRLPGEHNVRNVTAAWLGASLAGVGRQRFQNALLDFSGIRRRQEILFDRDGIIVVDDFAHHPTAVAETIRAMRSFYPRRRLLAVFEPRTNSSRRNLFQDRYARAFDAADWVGVKPPRDLDKVPADQRLDTARLIRDISINGRLEAHLFHNRDQLVEALLRELQPGDLVLFMSNGDFDDVPRTLCRKLADGA